MNFSLLGTEQVECRPSREHNEDHTQHGDGTYPLAVEYLHDSVVGRVDQKVPYEYVQDERGNLRPKNGSKDDEKHVEAGHN